MSFQLKPGLLLGAATSATQIEGGELDHNWNDWYRCGWIKDGSDPARATDHYHRWREDADLMADLGLQVYRFGIEWARICPTPERVDEAAIAHYREEITYLRKKGIKLLLTIHHFTNPMWFEERGGFLKKENLRYFLDFTELVVRSFGDLVAEYITINEPNVYATNSYYFGDWPPGKKSFSKALTIMANLAYCHIRSYELIHKIRREMGYQNTKVSLAHHLRVFDPANPKNLRHRIYAKLLDYFFQGLITQAIFFGKFIWPLKAPARVERGEYADFIGLNYYTRSTISQFNDGVRAGAPKNDLGWEIYPEGLIRCAEKLYGLLARPIYITENGTCDNQDAFRCRYLYDHLKAVCESALPIERYYHWCFCDNFEWSEGESARFGLVHVDYPTQQRTVKKSGTFFAAIIKEGGVSQELYDEYVGAEKYPY
ncbi:MAG TPA: glycoside hydrolase family 1 protein [Firmicutes bacterium]|nr:glycoside hydrolase family 1 protein [Bacillota bacterium]